jgi:hypothetical protein
MRLERKDIQFPLWRKKVDISLFDHNSTPIPAWAAKMWGISAGSVGSSVKSSKLTLAIQFEGQAYDGWITAQVKGRKSAQLRLFFSERLAIALKKRFVMSYLRAIESKLSPVEHDVEDDSPFWEFLDIEFDNASNQIFFTAYYTQRPYFPNLFQHIIQSAALVGVAEISAGRSRERYIYKHDWRPRAELKKVVDGKNVIYLLVDSSKALVYAGVAKDLVKRLAQDHPSIPAWDYFRYDQLPAGLTEYRENIERMMIRYLASLLPNEQNIPSFEISTYRLANLRIDR